MKFFFEQISGKIKVAPIVLSLNLIYSTTDFKISKVFKFITNKRSASKNDDYESRHVNAKFFEQCFERMFISVNKNEAVALLLINVGFMFKFEIYHGSLSLLKVIALAYAGTVLCCSPKDTYRLELEKQSPQGRVYNSQVFNIFSLSLAFHFIRYSRKMQIPNSGLAASLITQYKIKKNPLFRLQKLSLFSSTKKVLLFCLLLGYFIDYDLKSINQIKNHYDFRTPATFIFLLLPMVPKVPAKLVNFKMISKQLRKQFENLRNKNSKI